MATIRSGDASIGRFITHCTNLTDAARDIPIWATQKTGLIKAVVEVGD